METVCVTLFLTQQQEQQLPFLSSSGSQPLFTNQSLLNLQVHQISILIVSAVRLLSKAILLANKILTIVAYWFQQYKPRRKAAITTKVTSTVELPQAQRIMK